jgi:hypothetical protein
MQSQDATARIKEAASLIRSARYDPRMLELDNFLAHPEQSWPILRRSSMTARLN